MSRPIVQPPSGEWGGAALSTGGTLGELAARDRVLLVFLRHSG